MSFTRTLLFASSSSADHNGLLRIYPVRIFKLVFDISAHDVHLRTDALLPQLVSSASDLQPFARSPMNAMNTSVLSGCRDLCSACLHQSAAVVPCQVRSPTPGVARSADFLNKMVVSAAAAYSTLCTDLRCDEFKRCLCVVVQSSNDPRIHRVFDTHRIQVLPRARSNASLAVIAQII